MVFVSADIRFSIRVSFFLMCFSKAVLGLLLVLAAPDFFFSQVAVIFVGYSLTGGGLFFRLLDFGVFLVI